MPTWPRMTGRSLPRETSSASDPSGQSPQPLGHGGASDVDQKEAFAAGLFTLAEPLTVSAPATGAIRWSDGRTVRASLSTPQQAVAQMHADSAGTCTSCSPLRLSSPRLGTMTLATDDGPAVVPAWVFTVPGSAVRVVHPALSPTAGVDIAPTSTTGLGVSIEAATASADQRSLVVTFTGSPGPASRPCGADYTARAVESARAVVVIIYEFPAPGEQACSTIGAKRTATATLAAPLAGRAILELRQGTPVPTKRTRPPRGSGRHPEQPGPGRAEPER